MSNSLRPHGLYPTRLLWPWNSSGKNTREGRHSHLQGLFLTQGSNSGLPHCMQILYHLSHKEAYVFLITRIHHSKICSNHKMSLQGIPQCGTKFISHSFNKYLVSRPRDNHPFLKLLLLSVPTLLACYSLCQTLCYAFCMHYFTYLHSNSLR